MSRMPCPPNPDMITDSCTISSISKTFTAETAEQAEVLYFTKNKLRRVKDKE
jgi:hypothetical protein